MILEAAILNVKPGQEADFERAFDQAKSIISSMPGFLGFELQHCIEVKSRYLLLVRWDTLEAHTIGFRQSAGYREWKALLHHFYAPFPVVEHFESVFEVTVD